MSGGKGRTIQLQLGLSVVQSLGVRGSYRNGNNVREFVYHIPVVLEDQADELSGGVHAPQQYDQYLLVIR